MTRRCLDLLSARGGDPVYRAFMSAPVDHEPLTAEDVAAIEEGKADVTTGDVISWDDYVAASPADR